MKKLLSSVLMLFIALSLNAQSRTLKKVMAIRMPGDLGRNGASLVYHPVWKKYVAAMAGNSTYPLVSFDLKGKPVSDTSFEAGFDVRGMWYNSKIKTIQANGYNDFGWTNFKFDSHGNPVSNELFLAGQNQPDPQSVGLFNDKLQRVYFLKDISIVEYNMNGDTVKTYQLYPKIVGDDNMGDGLPEEYNKTPIYTGIPKGEIGLLNNVYRQIELFNLATGKPTVTWKLPEDAPWNDNFNFAYANGIVWLFDKDLRTWYGYK
ncbi:MAG: hypothetical protein JST86_10080 [Bacteroidetes bacterium]|nr:hypothetical protein [Bacteroidota bacterium]